ncbi:uncharacterized protein G2W53_010756 [Senna tora]|uniref:Uncharacterized protein n=1 Tax=Senna tora TaxID=362788 RepID=A0A834X086_9FABA|nr:uncharacterized protein G2W53_010756 [Senna tora]
MVLCDGMGDGQMTCLGRPASGAPSVVPSSHNWWHVSSSLDSLYAAQSPPLTPPIFVVRSPPSTSPISTYYFFLLLPFIMSGSDGCSSGPTELVRDLDSSLEASSAPEDSPTTVAASSSNEGPRPDVPVEPWLVHRRTPELFSGDSSWLDQFVSAHKSSLCRIRRIRLL